MSPALFSYFADQNVGKMPISWVFTDDSAPPAPAPAPTTTTTTPPAQDYTPPVPTIPTSSISNDYVAVNDVTPPTTPVDVPAEPTPEPDSTTDTPTTTDSATPDATTPTPDATPTPTPPTLGEQLALAMQGNDPAVLGSALVELGCMLQNSTNTST